MIKVSVIISAYNAKPYIKSCIDSILQQTLREYEIICVDDASTDETPAVLKEYSSHYDNVILITNQKNKGAGEARNIGLRRAKGKYVIFLDADDVFENDMLEKACLRAEQYRADICIFKENQFVNQGNYTEYPYAYGLMALLSKKGSFSPLDVQEMIFSLWNGWAWDKLFNREFILQHGLEFQNIRTSEDGYFVHAAMASAQTITFIDEILIHHRINVENSLSNTRNQSFESCYLYLRELKRYLEKNNIYVRYKKSFINWAGDFLYWNYCTLNEECRKDLFCAMKDYIIDELGLYHEEMYFNPFYYWYIDKIKKSTRYYKGILPVDESEKYTVIYKLNKTKIEELFLYIKQNNYEEVAIWGAGLRGSAFLQVYGMDELIKYVFDRDKGKIGKQIACGYNVQDIGEVLSEKKMCILVMNCAHFPYVLKMVRNCNKAAGVFDMDSYLSLPLEIQDCIE